jgi:hypothetical protein
MSGKKTCLVDSPYLPPDSTFVGEFPLASFYHEAFLTSPFLKKEPLLSTHQFGTLKRAGIILFSGIYMAPAS